jgi:hypothetical protein
MLGVGVWQLADELTGLQTSRGDFFEHLRFVVIVDHPSAI